MLVTIKNRRGEVVFTGSTDESEDTVRERYLKEAHRFSHMDFQGWYAPRGGFLDKSFNYCSFDNTLFREARFYSSTFSHCTMKNVEMHSTTFYNCSLQGNEIVDSDFRYARFVGCFVNENNWTSTIVRSQTWSADELVTWKYAFLFDDGNDRKYRLQRGLIAHAHRSDGHLFRLWDTEDTLIITAGCRFFRPKEAVDHWWNTRGDTPLGRETKAILELFRAQANVRDLRWE